ncbi:unnamed protein product [Owenia fusiformis]|uniref:Uncharacterized protein n=1 Tax=Owenia fusiformis TaxID=6347 RepID=A0A8S4MVL9_OWEFU|nr:unnamed protein product [Owenia fusiformis]
MAEQGSIQGEITSELNLNGPSTSSTLTGNEVINDVSLATTSVTDYVQSLVEEAVTRKMATLGNRPPTRPPSDRRSPSSSYLHNLEYSLPREQSPRSSKKAVETGKRGNDSHRNDTKFRDYNYSATHHVDVSRSTFRNRSRSPVSQLRSPSRLSHHSYSHTNRPSDSSPSRISGTSRQGTQNSRSIINNFSSKISQSQNSDSKPRILDSDDNEPSKSKSSEEEAVLLVRSLWDSTISALEIDQVNSSTNSKESLTRVALQKVDESSVTKASLPCPPVFHQLVQNINNQISSATSGFNTKGKLFRIKSSNYRLAKGDDSVVRPLKLNNSLGNLVPNDKTFSDFFKNADTKTQLSNKNWKGLEENLRAVLQPLVYSEWYIGSVSKLVTQLTAHLSNNTDPLVTQLLDSMGDLLLRGSTASVTATEGILKTLTNSALLQRDLIQEQVPTRFRESMRVLPVEHTSTTLYPESQLKDLVDSASSNLTNQALVTLAQSSSRSSKDKDRSQRQSRSDYRKKSSNKDWSKSQDKPKSDFRDSKKKYDNKGGKHFNKDNRFSKK